MEKEFFEFKKGDHVRILHGEFKDDTGIVACWYPRKNKIGVNWYDVKLDVGLLYYVEVSENSMEEI